MKKAFVPALLVLFLVIFRAWPSLSQESGPPAEDEVSLDLLRAPVSPAATLLGISPAQVERPSDPAAFMASVNAATGGFTGFPASYAVDLAPTWLFAGEKITIEDFLSRNIKKSLAQSLVVSLATHAANTEADTLPDVTRVAAGVKISLIRGWIDPATTQQIDEARKALGDLAKAFDTAFDSLRAADRRTRLLDSLIRTIVFNTGLSFEEKEALTETIRTAKSLREDTLRQIVRERIATGRFDDARQALEKIRVQRFGPKLDLAAAIAWDFPGMKFADGRYSTVSAWAMLGYEYPFGLSCLFLLRYSHFSNIPLYGGDELALYHNEQSFDAGLRVIYSPGAGPFNASLEGIYRAAIGASAMDPSWRFTFNAEYEVGRNKKLSLTLGRDFEGNYTGEGDLIVALNFLLGLGTGKKL